MNPALIDLVTDVVNTERDALEALDFEGQRERFLRHVRRRDLLRRTRGWLALAAAAGFGLAVYAARFSPALTFEVEGNQGSVGDFLTAPKNSSLFVNFSDGSRLSLNHEARARVLDVNRRGARLMLERGALQATVVHAAGTDWQIDAGPFRVQVVGTKFELAWDPTRERFALELREGSVKVSGPEVYDGCVVPKGGRLQVGLKQGTRAGACVVNEPEAKRAGPPRAPPSPVEASATPPEASVVGDRPAPPSWRQLAARGQHAAAWALVESLGFDSIRAGAGASDLILLADLARFSRRPHQATAALLQLRTRFAGSPAAKDASFLLGRVATDQLGAPYPVH